MSGHVHDFTGLWSNFGPRGPQDVHYHVCHGMRCVTMLIGDGHNCDGDPAHHREGRLADLGQIRAMRDAIAADDAARGDQ